MNGEIEAAGASITAGLAASALEGKTGSQSEPSGNSAGHHGACANCGATLSGAYCATCGQSAHLHRSLGHFLEEAFHGLFHFDTKAMRTLPMLAFRPGTLTAQYVHGKRARYISPIALFLFTIFLMFLTFALAMGHHTPGGEPGRGGAASVEVRQAEQDLRNAQAEQAAAQAEIAELTKETAPSPESLAEANEALARAQEDLQAAQRELDALAWASLPATARKARLEQVLAQLDINAAQARAKQDTAELEAIGVSRALITSALEASGGPPDGVRADIGADGSVKVKVDPTKSGGLEGVFEQIRRAESSGKLVVNTGNKDWDKKLREKARNPELAWYKIQNTAYKFSFLLVPISLPFLWLMFAWKRGVTLFDHTVFVLYSLSFMSLLLIVALLLGRLGEPVREAVTALATLSIPVHMFFQLKGAYGLRIGSALWRTCALVASAGVSMGLFLVTIFALGLTG